MRLKLFIWFLYKIVVFNKNFFFYKNINFNYLFVNYFILKNAYLLFNLVLNNSFKKKLMFVILKKSYRNRFVWINKKHNLFKIKSNFIKHTFFKKRKIKKKYINRIIKLKRLSGLFKKKLNLRITVLKKRSMIFNNILKNKFYKKKFKKKNKHFKKRFKFYNYRVSNIEMKKKRKLVFFENRKMIRIFLKNKSLKKQNKLSSYIINLLNLNSKNLLNFFEFRLNIILIKSHFFNNIEDSNFFIKNGFISVNNTTTYDTNFLVKTNDIIKFKNKHQYYLFYRNNINKSLFSLKKLNWAFYRFKKKNRFKKIFPKVYHWIYSGIHFGFDIPFFLEVDYVNLSIIFLYKPLNTNLINYTSIKFLNFYLTRLYNWSYIT